MFEVLDRNYPNLDEILSVLEVSKWKTANRVLEVLYNRNNGEYSSENGTLWYLYYSDPLSYIQKRLLANSQVQNKKVSSMSDMEKMLLEKGISKSLWDDTNSSEQVAFRKISSDGNKTFIGKLSSSKAEGLALI